MTRVVLLAAAAEEADAAEAWYFERDSEVAARFRTALGTAVAQPVTRSETMRVECRTSG